MRMNADVITQWSQLDDLSESWNAVLRQSAANSMFLTWEWIRAWTDVVGPQYEPLVVVARDSGGTVCGIAPFYIRRYRLLGAFPVKVLHVLGDTGADYPDLIVNKDRETETVDALSRGLERQRRRWDCIWLAGVSGWRGGCARLTGGGAGKQRLSRARSAPFAFIDLPSSMEAFERTLSAGRRQEMRRLRRKLLGAPGTRFTRCDSAPDLPAYLEALFGLHALHWKRKGESGTFDAQKKEIYGAFARAAMDAGWLRLHALRVGHEFKAVQAGCVYDGSYHALQEGYDPDFLPGAGNALRYEVIRTCIEEEGIRCYDFLGGFSEHKRMWLAKPREGHDLFIGRRTLLNSALFRAGVWPTGRYLRPVARPVAPVPPHLGRRVTNLSASQ
jgi:CelD/BcsL family acetyltransferase involved in cellulose biosynthesis